MAQIDTQISQVPDVLLPYLRADRPTPSRRFLLQFPPEAISDGT